jgi:hypothetical protein
MACLDFVEHSRTPRMPPSARLGAAKGRQNVVCRGRRQVTGSQDQYVGVIVFAGVARHGYVPAVCGASTGNLVGGHGRSNPHRVDDHAQICAPLCHGLGDFVSALGPIAGTIVRGAKIHSKVA